MSEGGRMCTKSNMCMTIAAAGAAEDKNVTHRPNTKTETEVNNNEARKPKSD